MPSRHRVIFLVYPGFETLDVAGPVSVFHAASHGPRQRPYELVYASVTGADILTNAGLAMRTSSLGRMRFGKRDILLVPGAEADALRAALADARLISALKRIAVNAGRIASVCSGAFLLAEAGLLSSLRATTHWEATRALRLRYPSVQVEPDALYVADGRVWTSAGVATGIDMALAMVKLDLGAAAMREVAQRLVVYSHRAGAQSQFSPMLAAQSAGGGDFSELIAWMDARLDEPVRVPDLARRCNLSERTFHRRFTQSVGETPARFLESLRMQRAKELFEAGHTVKAVSTATGFRSESGFRNAFEGRFGLSPSLFVAMHAGSE